MENNKGAIFLSLKNKIEESDSFVKNYIFSRNHQKIEDEFLLKALENLSLVKINEGKTYQTYSNESKKLILIPLSGAIGNNITEEILVSGEVQMLGNENNIILENLAEGNCSEFLEIKINPNFGVLKADIKAFEVLNNQLSAIIETQNAGIFLGKYTYRQDLLFERKENFNFFVYVVWGSFEINDRLVNQGDALSMKNCKSLEGESLSQESIVLIIIEEK
ncbi:hypothetical protein EGI22_14085 [Lacihabitans sp. LS3-19]|uniref:pirin family protein n=1 Tax=Lacihabitans sp. LS3-19 TaxID=2487335 RepID=UPI0020CF22FA|nr:hypothetical protein [Lacihabitans sp. LS3-19]MCP9769043.1 hypothetical protein [Lacihabitans sp. LS3-19]